MFQAESIPSVGTWGRGLLGVFKVSKEARVAGTGRIKGGAGKDDAGEVEEPDGIILLCVPPHVHTSSVVSFHLVVPVMLGR